MSAKLYFYKSCKIRNAYKLVKVDPTVCKIIPLLWKIRNAHKLVKVDQTVGKITFLLCKIWSAYKFVKNGLNCLQYTCSGHNHNLRSRPAFGQPKKMLSAYKLVKVDNADCKITFLSCKMWSAYNLVKSGPYWLQNYLYIMKNVNCLQICKSRPNWLPIYTSIK